MTDCVDGRAEVIVERSSPMWKHIEILYEQFSFANRNRLANPGVGSIQAAYEYSRSTLVNSIHELTGRNGLTSQAVLEFHMRPDGLVLGRSEDSTIQSPRRLAISELMEIHNEIGRHPSAFALHDDAERRHRYGLKWNLLLERSQSTGAIEVILRDWPDDLLTELLWDLAHRRAESLMHSSQGGVIDFVFDDESRLSCPRVGLQIRGRERSRQRVAPSESQLYLALISNRHPELDSITHGSLFSNRETQLDGRLADLALATRDRTNRFLSSFGDDGTRCELHVFQTGLAAVVVGLWLGLSDQLATNSNTPIVIPRYYRKNSVVVADTTPWSPYPEGRCW